MPDLLIIGQGLAGTAAAWEAHRRGLDVRIADPRSINQASWVASGLYNPIVLKRRTLVWQAHAMMEALEPHYSFSCGILGTRHLHPPPILHRIHDSGEENRWMGLLEDDRFAPFLRSVSRKKGPFVSGAGMVETQQTGWLNVPAYLADSRRYFTQRDWFTDAFVAPEDLHTTQGGFQW